MLWDSLHQQANSRQFFVNFRVRAAFASAAAHYYTSASNCNSAQQTGFTFRLFAVGPTLAANYHQHGRNVDVSANAD